MAEYDFTAARLISKIWATIAVLFLFAVIMFGVDDNYLSRILPNFRNFGRVARS